MHTGSFVWGDSSAAQLSSTGQNQFVARASGGVTFFSNSAATTGVNLPAGGGAWTTLSDRNVKANIVAVDSSAMLEKVAAMPIQLWNYTSQDASVKHIGPMARTSPPPLASARITRPSRPWTPMASHSPRSRDCIRKINTSRLRTKRSVHDRQITTRLAALEQAHHGGDNALQVVPTGLTLSWSVVVLGSVSLIVLLILSTVSLTLLFLRRRTTPA